jgi:hypothetical protein
MEAANSGCNNGTEYCIVMLTDANSMKLALDAYFENHFTWACMSENKDAKTFLLIAV